MPPARPRLHWRDIALVGIGGTFGTAARYLAERGHPRLAGDAGGDLRHQCRRRLCARAPPGTVGACRIGCRHPAQPFGWESAPASSADSPPTARSRSTPTQLAGGRPFRGGGAYAALTVVVGAIATVLGILAADAAAPGASDDLTVILLALAGGLGACLPGSLSTGSSGRIVSTYPIGTTVINVTGSLLLGLVVGLSAAQLLPDSGTSSSGPASSAVTPRSAPRAMKPCGCCRPGASAPRWPTESGCSCCRWPLPAWGCGSVRSDVRDGRALTSRGAP